MGVFNELLDSIDSTAQQRLSENQRNDLQSALMDAVLDRGQPIRGQLEQLLRQMLAQQEGRSS